MDFKSIWNGYIRIVSHLVPKPPMPAAIGIDIGTSMIKVVELARVNNGFEVRQFKVQPFEPSTASETLKKTLDELRITDQTLMTSVSGKGTLIRYVDMPRMSIEELRKAIAYDLDKYFPFDPATIYYDCHILDLESKDKKMPVLITAVKKELVDDRLKLFKQSGYDISRITTNAIATANAFVTLHGLTVKTQTAKALLDIGGSVSTLMIVDQQSPRFTRDIFMGSKDMTKRISNVLGLDVATVDAMKVKGERAQEFLAASEDTLVNLISEIRLSLDYFVNERNITVDELYLVGGGAQMEGLTAVFEKHLGFPVMVWQPLNAVKLNHHLNQKDITPLGPQLSVALGLGLSGL